MTRSMPFVPEDAPFTPEQRAWLNGLLAGMFSERETSAGAARTAERVAVLYASQSGTAEGLARKLAKALKTRGFAPRVSRSGQRRRGVGAHSAEAHAVSVFDCVESCGTRRPGTCHCRGSALYGAQSRTWRSLLHAAGRSRPGGRPAARLRPAKPKVPPAAAGCADDHDRSGNRDCSVPRIFA